MNQKDYIINKLRKNEQDEKSITDKYSTFKRFTDEQLLSASVFGLENPCWKIIVDNKEYYLSDAEYIKHLKHNLNHAKDMYNDLREYTLMLSELSR